MPRFFFHLRGDDLLMEDHKGMDLPNLHAALAEVIRARRELTDDKTGVRALSFEIATRQGRVLLKVPVDHSHEREAGLTH